MGDLFLSDKNNQLFNIQNHGFEFVLIFACGTSEREMNILKMNLIKTIFERVCLHSRSKKEFEEEKITTERIGIKIHKLNEKKIKIRFFCYPFRIELS